MIKECQWNRMVCSPFSDRLRELRLAEGKSPSVLSELIGLSRDMIRRYEAAEVIPTMNSLILIADYFGVSVDYLTGRSEKK